MPDEGRRERKMIAEQWTAYRRTAKNGRADKEWKIGPSATLRPIRFFSMFLGLWENVGVQSTNLKAKFKSLQQVFSSVLDQAKLSASRTEEKGSRQKKLCSLS